MSSGRLPRRTAAAGLAALAGIHVAWGRGSSWPLADRGALADAVIGRRGGAVPSPAACFAVAALLGTAATVVASDGARIPRLRRLGARTVVAVLATRGALGLAGRTDLLSPGSSSPRFRELDRRCYSPLCLTLAALALPATAGAPRAPRTR